ncbi:hypothetical protein KUCAC02_034780 [Chaenocephalus aceratus]|nr:hypothetical protein KUCAC02_034780 [Chaenocephalus aceratus]
MGTPMKAASSPSALSWWGSLYMVEIPETRDTNSALGGTLKRVPLAPADQGGRPQTCGGTGGRPSRERV